MVGSNSLLLALLSPVVGVFFVFFYLRFFVKRFFVKDNILLLNKFIFYIFAFIIYFFTIWLFENLIALLMGFSIITPTSVLLQSFWSPFFWICYILIHLFYKKFSNVKKIVLSRSAKISHFSKKAIASLPAFIVTVIIIGLSPLLFIFDPEPGSGIGAIYVLFTFPVGVFLFLLFPVLQGKKKVKKDIPYLSPTMSEIVRSIGRIILGVGIVIVGFIIFSFFTGS